MVTRSKQGLTKRYQNKRLTPNTHYAHLLSYMHFAAPIAIGIAPHSLLRFAKVNTPANRRYA